MTNDDRDPLTDRVIGLAIEVHRSLGPGLLESTYEECLCYEFSQHGIQFQRQVPLAVHYKDVRLDCGYRLDIVVERNLILEIKSVEQLSRLHEAQLLTYLKLSGIRTGLLLNFNVTLMTQGIRRLVF
jgi:GxxExxY protein